MITALLILILLVLLGAGDLVVYLFAWGSILALAACGIGIIGALIYGIYSLII